MSTLFAVLVATLAAVLGYRYARSFVYRRLAYVDGVHSAYMPVAAGLLAGAVALPLVALLPVVGAGTAVLFGISVGMGVAAGARSIRKRLSGW